MTKEKSFKELQKEWYEKIELELDFQDIEKIDHPNQPLKEWHSFKIPSKRFQIIQEIKTPYQKQIDDFMNHPDFTQACESIIKHGNSKFTIIQIKLIWELHAQGISIRQIARRVGRVKSRVDDVIKGLRTWMNLL